MTSIRAWLRRLLRRRPEREKAPVAEPAAPLIEAPPLFPGLFRVSLVLEPLAAGPTPATRTNLFKLLSGDYADQEGNPVSGGGGGGNHNLLSATHPDTVAGSPVQGDFLYANATPAWARFLKGSNGQFIIMVSGAPAWSAIPFSVGGPILGPAGAINVIAWRAPFACTVTNVRGYRVGGTGATINARKNGSLNHLASNLSLTSADTWMDGGSVQNTSYAAGDKLELMVVSISGAPTQIAIQVDFTRP